MKNFSIEIKWALRFTLLILAWAIGEKAVGLHDKYIADYLAYSMLFAIPAILFYYLAIAEKKKYFYNNSMTWKQGFITGLIISAIIAVFNPFAQLVIYKSITPHFFENVIKYKTTHTKMTLKTAQEFFNLKSYMLQSIFSALSYGVTTGAIVSLFLRNKKEQ